MLAIDSTYLLPMRSPICLHGKKALVGGSFAVADLQDRNPCSFEQLGPEMLANSGRRTPNANRMSLGPRFCHVLSSV